MAWTKTVDPPHYCRTPRHTPPQIGRGSEWTCDECGKVYTFLGRNVLGEAIYRERIPPGPADTITPAG